MPDDGSSQWDVNRRNLIRAGALTAAGGIAGCTNLGGNGGDGDGDGDGTPTGPVNIYTDYNNEDWQNRWEDVLIPGFNEEFPDIPVEIEYAGMQGSGENRLATLIQSGRTPEVYHSTITTMADLILNGTAVPINDVVEHLQSQNGEYLYEHTTRFDEMGGDYYLAPRGIILNGTFLHRTDLFGQLSLEPPETWSDLMEICESFDEDSSIEAAPFALSGTPTGKSVGLDFPALLRQAGGGMFRWTSDARDEAEVWFEEEHVIDALEFALQLTDYIPDPSAYGWAQSAEWWVSGRIASQFMANGFAIGVGVRAGTDDIVRASDVAVPPKMDGKDVLDRGLALPECAAILNGDNVQGAKEFVKWKNTPPERAAANLLLDPLRIIPPTQEILNTETYQNADFFQAYDGHLLDVTDKLYNEIAPHLESEERPHTLLTKYPRRFSISGQLMNQVLVAGTSPQEAYEEARESLEMRFQEAKELLAENQG